MTRLAPCIALFASVVGCGLGTSDECTDASDCLEGRACCGTVCMEAGECAQTEGAGGAGGQAEPNEAVECPSVDLVLDLTEESCVGDVWSLDSEWACDRETEGGPLLHADYRESQPVIGAKWKSARSEPFRINDCPRPTIEIEHAYLTGGNSEIRALLASSDGRAIDLFAVSGVAEQTELTLEKSGASQDVPDGTYWLELRVGSVRDAALVTIRAEWRVRELRLRGGD